MNDFLFDRTECPFGKSWERWVTAWYKWIVSIPKRENPCLDMTGEHCSINQNEDKVWFLAGTFGNNSPIKRECTVPLGKAILVPILVKEDSFAEDSDLRTESELVNRAKNATDRLLYVKAIIDGKNVECPEKYRVRSKVFDLIFPDDNIYDVESGITRSVCDGFWLFIKPFQVGRHVIYFSGETVVSEPYTRNFMKASSVYSAFMKQYEVSKENKTITFRVEVIYLLNVLAR
jgi:hypothetical protein